MRQLRSLNNDLQGGKSQSGTGSADLCGRIGGRGRGAGCSVLPGGVEVDDFDGEGDRRRRPLVLVEAGAFRAQRRGAFVDVGNLALEKQHDEFPAGIHGTHPEPDQLAAGVDFDAAAAAQGEGGGGNNLVDRDQQQVARAEREEQAVELVAAAFFGEKLAGLVGGLWHGGGWWVVRHMAGPRSRPWL